jgi:hypothetical protein
MERRSPIALFTTFFTMLVLSISFNACNRMSGDIEPQNSKSSVARKDSYSRLASGCSDLNDPVLTQTQRDRAVVAFGSAGGTAFDGAKAALPSLDDTYINNYSSLVFNYMNQITTAIRNGASDYAYTICVSVIPACPGLNVYISTSLKSYIDNYLNPIKSSIQTNSSLTSQQRDVLQNAIAAFESNFEYVSSMIESQYDCFPNPSWYGGYGPMVQPMGVLFGIGKVLRKVVNIVSTVVTHVFETALRVAVWGALGAIILGIPGSPLLIGAILGGLIGISNGVTAVLQGKYICIIYPCP